MLSLRNKKKQIENAQFNTMLCKGKMNLQDEKKKMAETAGAVPATLPGIFGGRARAKSIHPTTELPLVNR
jgi:hypothetical protein